MNNNFILASSSPRRKELLQKIYYDNFKIIPAEINETPLKNERPSAFAKRMAEEKAAEVLKNNPDDFILAADTVVACGRRILPKAQNKEDACLCLDLLSGRSHRVYSGICLLSKKSKAVKVVMTKVQFRRLSTRERKEYLQSGEWEGKAGGYAIQGLAEMYIKKISGSYSNVVGLPLCETSLLLMGKNIYPTMQV